jgi:hypothetical protein
MKGIISFVCSLPLPQDMIFDTPEGEMQLSDSKLEIEYRHKGVLNNLILIFRVGSTPFPLSVILEWLKPPSSVVL